MTAARGRILGAAAIAAALACGGDRRGGTSVEGTIARTRDDQVAIRVPEGSEITLRVGPETKVTLAGRDASAKDLPEGAGVRASYGPSQGGGEPVALTIEANGGAGRATMRGGGSEMQGANRGPAGGPQGPGDAPRGGGPASKGGPAPAPAPSPTVNGAHGGEGGNPSGSSGPAHSGPEREAK